MTSRRPRIATHQLGPMARAIAALSLLAFAGLIALSLSASAKDVLQEQGPRTPCIDECMARGCGKVKTTCYQHCKTLCFVQSAHPDTGTLETAPAVEAQVCCRSMRGFRALHRWSTREACKPPQRTIMDSTAKCPLQRSQ